MSSQKNDKNLYLSSLLVILRREILWSCCFNLQLSLFLLQQPAKHTQPLLNSCQWMFLGDSNFFCKNKKLVKKMTLLNNTYDKDLESKLNRQIMKFWKKIFSQCANFKLFASITFYTAAWNLNSGFKGPYIPLVWHSSDSLNKYKFNSYIILTKY